MDAAELMTRWELLCVAAVALFSFSGALIMQMPREDRRTLFIFPTFLSVVVGGSLAVFDYEKFGARVIAGGRVREALGGRRLSGIEVLAADGSVLRLDIDLLALSGGWTPSVALSSHRGTKPVWDERLAAHLPGPEPGLLAVGAAAGEMTLARCLATGNEAGARAAALAAWTFAS